MCSELGKLAVPPGARLRIRGALPARGQGTPGNPAAGPGLNLLYPLDWSPGTTGAVSRGDRWLLLGSGRADGEVTGVDGVLNHCLKRPEPCLVGAVRVKRPRLSYITDDADDTVAE